MPAANVLVFMVVSLNGGWKIPVGYFFVDGLTGAEMANLVTVCLKKIHECGVDIVSLVCDGPSSHLKMMSELKMSLDPFNLKTHFPHPSNPELPVHVLLDICHMLKLSRNCLAALGTIIDGNGDKIRWQFISQLHEIQARDLFLSYISYSSVVFNSLSLH